MLQFNPHQQTFNICSHKDAKQVRPKFLAPLITDNFILWIISESHWFQVFGLHVLNEGNNVASFIACSLQSAHLCNFCGLTAQPALHTIVYFCNFEHFMHFSGLFFLIQAALMCWRCLCTCTTSTVWRILSIQYGASSVGTMGCHFDAFLRVWETRGLVWSSPLKQHISMFKGTILSSVQSTSILQCAS